MLAAVLASTLNAPSTAAAPPMSPFIDTIAPLILMLRPPVS
jgi:hypothetical protein